jgi:hypothetical protein
MDAHTDCHLSLCAASPQCARASDRLLPKLIVFPSATPLRAACALGATPRSQPGGVRRPRCAQARCAPGPLARRRHDTDCRLAFRAAQCVRAGVVRAAACALVPTPRSQPGGVRRPMCGARRRRLLTAAMQCPPLLTHAAGAVRVCCAVASLHAVNPSPNLTLTLTLRACSRAAASLHQGTPVDPAHVTLLQLTPATTEDGLAPPKVDMQDYAVCNCNA